MLAASQLQNSTPVLFAPRTAPVLRVSAASMTLADHVHPMPRLPPPDRTDRNSSLVDGVESAWHWLRFWLPSPRLRSRMRLRGQKPKPLVPTRPSLLMTNPLRVRPSLHASSSGHSPRAGRRPPSRRPNRPANRASSRPTSRRPSNLVPRVQREPAPLRASRPAKPTPMRTRQRCSHCAPVLVTRPPTADRARQRPTLLLLQTGEPQQVPHATPRVEAMQAARRRSRSTTSWSRASSRSLRRTTSCAAVSSSTTGPDSMRDSHLWCLSRSKILCSNPSLGRLVRKCAGNPPLAFIRHAQTPGEAGNMRVQFFQARRATTGTTSVSCFKWALSARENARQTGAP